MVLYLGLLTPLMALPALLLLDRLERWTMTPVGPRRAQRLEVEAARPRPVAAPATSPTPAVSRTPWRSPTPSGGRHGLGGRLVENRSMSLDLASRSRRSPR